MAHSVRWVRDEDLDDEQRAAAREFLTPRTAEDGGTVWPLDELGEADDDE
jgi:hypothetical protein